MDAARWDPSVPVLTEWVAVLSVATSPEALDDDAAALLDRVPDHGVIGRVDAHQGLAERLEVPAGTWWSGMAAETLMGLERALTRTGALGLAPLLVGEFRVLRLSQ